MEFIYLSEALDQCAFTHRIVDIIGNNFFATNFTNEHEFFADIREIRDQKKRADLFPIKSSVSKRAVNPITLAKVQNLRKDEFLIRQ
jgi:hypothetical protein